MTSASQSRPARARSGTDVVAAEPSSTVAARGEVAERIGRAARDADAAVVADEKFQGTLGKLPYFTEDRRRARREELLDQLTVAGRGMVSAYSALLEDRDLWEKLARSELDYREISLTGHAWLLEAATQPVAPLLRQLGYGDGPPPAEEWVERVQQPLRLLLQGGGVVRSAEVAASAEFHLRELVRRLALLVEASGDGGNPAVDIDTDREVRSRLRRLLRAGRDVAAPTMVVAAASDAGSALFTGNAEAALEVGEGAAVASLVGLGAAALVAQVRTASSGSPTIDLRCSLDSLRDYVRLAGEPPREPFASLLVRRAALQVVADAGRLDDPRYDAWLDWAVDIDAAVRDPDFDTRAVQELHRQAKDLVERRGHP